VTYLRVSGGPGTLFANDPDDEEINISLSLQGD